MKDNIKYIFVGFLVVVAVIGACVGFSYLYFQNVAINSIGEQSHLRVSSDFDKIKGVTYYRTVEQYKEDLKNGTLPKDSIYLIKSGDTLSSISSSVGRSVDELAHLNEIANVDLIYADSSLRIPPLSK